MNGSLNGRRRRVLVVVSAFRPALLADMQRARMLAWELPKFGWEVEVLTPHASQVRQDVVEPDARPFFAADTPVHEVGSCAKRAFAFLGSRSHVWPSLWPMARRGAQLIRTGRFDLLYFSTTAFLYFRLGPYWRRRFKTRYVIDFHDPWLRDLAEGSSPRGRKEWLLRHLAEDMERSAVIDAAGLVAVSPAYVETLRRRYESYRPAWLASDRHAVIPFGALASDLAVAAKTEIAAQGNSKELAVHYVGAGGPIMSRSFELICRAMALLRQHGDPGVDRVRVRLFGTAYNWRQGDAKPLESIARTAGVGDLVVEEPGRVSYRRSLELLLQSDGALILGVDDTGYMPSKLFSYALSGKPLLASLRRDGPAFAQFNEIPNLGHAMWFDRSGEMPLGDAARVVKAFLEDAAMGRNFDRRAVLEPFLAPAMARRHADLFNACLASSDES